MTASGTRWHSRPADGRCRVLPSAAGFPPSSFSEWRNERGSFTARLGLQLGRCVPPSCLPCSCSEVSGRLQALRSPDFLHPVFFLHSLFFFHATLHLSTLQDFSRKVMATEEKPAEVTQTDGAYTDISPPSNISVASIGAQPISQRMAASQACSLLHPLACSSTVCVPCSLSSKHKAAPVSMLQTSMQDPCTAKHLASCLLLIMYLNQGLVNLCNVLTLVSCWTAQVLTRCLKLNRYSVVFWMRT